MSQNQSKEKLKPDLRDSTLEELADVVKKIGGEGYRFHQLSDWLYSKRVSSFTSMKNIPAHLLKILSDNYTINIPSILKKEISADGCQKYLFSLPDGANVESVIIPEKRRTTICLSTQAGCRYACSFCASRDSGFTRNLTVSEITGQLIAAEKDMGVRCTNIVFMGIGEPLDNFLNLVKSIEVFSSKDGFGIGRRKMTVSTCGIVPGINKLSRLMTGVGLSVSLHSAIDSKRSELMPVNKAYPLKQLKKAILDFEKRNGYGVTLEYLLMSGVNTNQEDLLALERFLVGLKSKINLIPYNPVESASFKVPCENESEKFMRKLGQYGIFYTLRTPRGADISAACGQLRTALMKDDKS